VHKRRAPRRQPARALTLLSSSRPITEEGLKPSPSSRSRSTTATGRGRRGRSAIRITAACFHVGFDFHREPPQINGYTLIDISYGQSQPNYTDAEASWLFGTFIRQGASAVFTDPIINRHRGQDHSIASICSGKATPQSPRPSWVRTSYFPSVLSAETNLTPLSEGPGNTNSRGGGGSAGPCPP